MIVEKFSEIIAHAIQQDARWRWLAQDADGTWWLFDKMPWKAEACYSRTDGSVRYAGATVSGEKWWETLMDIQPIREARMKYEEDCMGVAPEGDATIRYETIRSFSVDGIRIATERRYAKGWKPVGAVQLWHDGVYTQRMAKEI